MRTIIEIFKDEQLKIIDDTESCYVAEDDPPTPPQVEEEVYSEPQEKEEVDMDTGNIGDGQEERADGDDLTPAKEDTNNNSYVDHDVEVFEDDAPSPVLSDLCDGDYNPISLVKGKFEPKRQLKTHKNDATK